MTTCSENMKDPRLREDDKHKNPAIPGGAFFVLLLTFSS